MDYLKKIIDSLKEYNPAEMFIDNEDMYNTVQSELANLDEEFYNIQVQNVPNPENTIFNDQVPLLDSQTRDNVNIPNNQEPSGKMLFHTL